MKKLSLILITLVVLPFALLSQSTHEWEDETVNAINKEKAHSTYMPYATTQEAMKDVWAASPYYQNLNGTWKFNWVKHPDMRPKDFYKNDFEVFRNVLVP